MKIVHWNRRADLRLSAAVAPIILGLAIAPDAFAQEQSATLEELVVTARKREENLQDIPLAVSAFSADALEARGVRSVTGLASAVPNVAITGQADGDFDTNIIIRGISSSARNVGFESSLGVYLDGVFMGRTSGFDQELADVTRVEVLRGPQGTLFGKNTISGAISIVTADPTPTPIAKVFGEVGNFNLWSGGVAVSGPIIDGRLAGKLSVSGGQHDGYVDNLNSTGRGADTLGRRETWNARAALQWQAGDDLKIDLRGDYGEKRGSVFETEAISGFGYVPGVRTADVDRPGAELRKLGGASLTATLDLPNELTLTSISAYRMLDFGIDQHDLDSSPVDLLYADIADGLQQYSQEFRLASDASERLNYVAGLYLFQQIGKSDRLFAFGADAGLPGGVAIKSRVKTSSIAGFVNADYRFSDTVALNGGVRFTKEEKDLRYRQEGGDLIGYPTENLTDSLSDQDASLTIALNYTPADESLLYLKYSTGFKSGGWNADLKGTGGAPFTAADLRFEPEQIASYEAGYKVTTWGRRLRINIAAYYLSYEDIQVSQFIGGLAGFKTTNAGKAHSQGVEIEVTARPIPELELTAGLGVTDARYDEYPNAGVQGLDLSGTRLEAPKYTGSLSADYTRPAGPGDIIGGFTYSFRSAYPVDPLDPNSGTDAHDLLDARLGYRWPSGLEAYVWGQNLFDQTYEETRGTISNLELFGLSQVGVSYGPPRTFGVRVNYAF